MTEKTAGTAEVGDERTREVLREIVRLHAETGRPVSSRRLAKLPRFHASAATLRNIMADLTDAGFLTQPHTSAGRVPTEKGYRYYVLSLMRPREITPNLRELVSADLDGAGHEPARLFPAVSRLLSRLTGEVGLVIAPDARRTVVREIRFVPIGHDRAVTIQVGEGDVVFTRVIDTEGRFDAASLERAGNYLTAHFGGSTLLAMRNRIELALQEDRTRLDAIVTGALELAGKLIAETSPTQVFTEGTRQLLGRAELSNPDLLRKIYRSFEEKADLLELVERCLEGQGPRIVMGTESHLTADAPLSAVLTRYGGENQPPGVLGIVGSLRMSYPKVIPLVEFLGRAVSERLSAPARAGGESKNGRIARS